jgi:Ca2+-binding EF-hand superfamily protein
MANEVDDDGKVKENRLRRWAGRWGFALRKSRKLISLNNRGGYMLVDPSNNSLVRGVQFDLTQADVEEILKDYEKKFGIRG